MARVRAGCPMLHRCMHSCFTKKIGCSCCMKIYSSGTMTRILQTRDHVATNRLVCPHGSCSWDKDLWRQMDYFILALCFRLMRSQLNPVVSHYCFKQARHTKANQLLTGSILMI